VNADPAAAGPIDRTLVPENLRAAYGGSSMDWAGADGGRE